MVLGLRTASTSWATSVNSLRLLAALVALSLPCTAMAGVTGPPVTKAAGDGFYVNIDGDVMTGLLTLPSLTCSVCVFTSTVADGTVGFIFNVANSHSTGNLFEVREADGAAYFTISPSGVFTTTTSFVSEGAFFAKTYIQNSTASNGCATSSGDVCLLDGLSLDGTLSVLEAVAPTPRTGSWTLHADSDNILTFGDADGTFHPIGGAVPAFDSYAFGAVASGVHYIGLGYYEAPAAEMVLTNAAPTQTLGAASDDEPWGAHAIVVNKGDGATDGSDLVLTVTGTSVTDAGVRTASDSEVILLDALLATAATDGMSETVKKWVGQITYTLSSAGGSTFNYSGNYGFAKYNDFADRDFTVTSFECSGFAGANTSIEIELLHHETTPWTHHASAFVPGADVLAKMSDVYSSETNVTSGKQFAFKRTPLSHAVLGDDSEGVLIRITTGANNAVDHATCRIGVEL